MLDASGQALVYIYARETKAEADIAKVLTFDEARRIAVNVAKLPEFDRTQNSDCRFDTGQSHARRLGLFSGVRTATSEQIAPLQVSEPPLVARQFFAKPSERSPFA